MSDVVDYFTFCVQDLQDKKLIFRGEKCLQIKNKFHDSWFKDILSILVHNFFFYLFIKIF